MRRRLLDTTTKLKLASSSLTVMHVHVHSAKAALVKEVNRTLLCGLSVLLAANVYRELLMMSQLRM